MSKPKKTPKVKEPIRLRAKALSNGNKSLYLDKYADGARGYEFLKLYLIPERTAADKATNAATLQAANAIKAARIVELANGKAGIRTANKNLTLSDWIDTMISKREGKVSVSSINVLKRAKLHLSKYAPGVKIADVDKAFCIGFADYLRTAKVMRTAKGKEPRQLSATTQAEMLNILSLILNAATREGIVTCNPVQLLTSTERIKKPESAREYLTPDEVRELIKTPIAEAAANDKAAFLFACFCGLRHSDIVALRWGNIVADGNGNTAIRTTMKKTRRVIVVPLSAEAQSFLPARNEDGDDDVVFKMQSIQSTERRLKKWGAAAGVTKRLTFHVSRHTFATMMITAGADLYVASKLLGHTNISTTQIYAKIVDAKKVEAVNLISNLF